MKTLLHSGTLVWQFIRYTCSFVIFMLFFALGLQAQKKEWDKTLGSNGEEAVRSLQQTSDGGYIIGGWSDSDNRFGDKTEKPRGETDFWVVKVDAAGNKQWDRTLGGDSFDELTSLQQTRDGGYILGGYSYSGISGDKTEASRGESDYWIVKLDAAGNKQWDQTFGGSEFEGITSLQQTNDGGYILGGSSGSGISGDKSEAARGGSDYWIIKLDESGNKIWDKTLGSDGDESLASLQQTTDGGYVLGGSSDSGISGDKTEASKGSSDFWVVKLDAAGNKQWDRTIGSMQGDRLGALRQTNDGGYILGGTSGSGISGDKTEASRGGSDYWVVKIDAAGNKEWNRTFGGDDIEGLEAIQLTSDGGYVLGGSSYSEISGDKTEANRGVCEENNGYKYCSSDYWVVKLNSNGIKEWDRTLGGNDYEHLTSLQQTSDGGYILGGGSLSGISGDKSEESRGPGGPDFWIVKLSGEEPCTTPTPAITVIPTSDVYTGGDSLTIYLGYGPKSVQLVASGGERYTWSPSAGLSSTDVADPVFTPTTAGSYTFTVTAYSGTCSATASVNITVVDARCGTEGKVQVCHNGRTLCLAASAVAAHLRNHNSDRLGSCQEEELAENTITVTVPLKVFPNPFRDVANIEFSLPVGGPFRLELYNASGKMLGLLAEGEGELGQVARLNLRGEQLREGIYYLRLFTQDEVQTVRVVLKK